MKRILLFLLLIAFIGTIANNGTNHKTNYPTVHPYADSVYICDSKSAYAYHISRDCSGLNHCTHGIYKVSLRDAENKYGRVACQKCTKGLHD
ncbi:MAG TPA: hypothetical protein VK588_02200 [Chitinophagaceae bacterium]|nr:hypothetical protein [Chitinophagaceae bacterium]